jgi:hypothetical protein
VPAQRQWDDQFARSDRIAREQRNFRVFRGNTPSELAQQATELLCEHIAKTVVAGANGGIKTARLIYGMLG